MVSTAIVSTWMWLPLILSICLHGGCGGYAEPQESPPADSVVCISQEQCLEQFSRMRTGGNFIVGSFEEKGCFSINRDVFFGTGAVDEFNLADSDLPGILKRIWCDKDNTTPAMKPSDRPEPFSTLTYYPTAQLSIYRTKQPWLPPAPINPTSKPSHTPIAKLPFMRPISNNPTSLNKTNQPTPMLIASSNPTSRPSQTVPASTQPTPNATSFQSIANSTFLLSDVEVAVSYRPTTRPTANPLSGRSSLAPTTANPRRLPSNMPISKQPTAIPTPKLTAANPTISPTIPGQPKNSTVIDGDVPQGAQDTTLPQWYPVGISPLTISLITDSQPESVD